MIKEYNKEFGDFRVKDINYDVIYKMKQLGFKTLEEYFEYLNYMKSKGYIY